MLAGCTNHQSEATQYATAHAVSIVNSTRPLWIHYSAHPAEVPVAGYTPEIRALHPTRVVAARQGVWIYIDSVYANITGIFVRYDPAFPTPNTKPPDSDQMTFVPLGRDVYWFSIPR